MDDTLIYRKIELEELNLDLFRKFERRQTWPGSFKNRGSWVEKPVSLVEDGQEKTMNFC